MSYVSFIFYTKNMRKYKIFQTWKSFRLMCILSKTCGARNSSLVNETRYVFFRNYRDFYIVFAICCKKINSLELHFMVCKNYAIQPVGKRLNTMSKPFNLERRFNTKFSRSTEKQNWSIFQHYEIYIFRLVFKLPGLNSETVSAPINSESEVYQIYSSCYQKKQTI